MKRPTTPFLQPLAPSRPLRADLTNAFDGNETIRADQRRADRVNLAKLVEAMCWSNGL